MQFLQDRVIGLVVFGTDWYYTCTCMPLTFDLYVFTHVYG